MANESKRDLLNGALSALQRGDPKEALDFLDRAWKEWPDDAEVLSMRGVALARNGRKEEATRSFRKSVEIAPRTGRFYYNFAVHLRDLGQTKEAKEMATLAMNLEPKYPGLRALCDSLEIEFAPDRGFSIRQAFLQPELPSRGLVQGTVHTISAIAENERLWTGIGWAIIVLSIISVLSFRLHGFFHMPGPGEGKGFSIVGGALLNGDPVSLGLMFFFLFLALSSLIWTVVDIVDRRSRVVWLVPMFVFCLCAVPGIPQILYMAAGRK